MGKKFIQNVCCQSRLIEIMKSLRDPYIRIENVDEYKCDIVCGSKGGYVEYRYRICKSCVDGINEAFEKCDDKCNKYKLEWTDKPEIKILSTDCNLPQIKDPISFIKQKVWELPFCLKYKKSKIFDMLNERVIEVEFTDCFEKVYKVTLVRSNDYIKMKCVNTSNHKVYDYDFDKDEWIIKPK